MSSCSWPTATPGPPSRRSCSAARTIDRWVKRFHRKEPRPWPGTRPGRRLRFGAGWLAVVVDLVSTKVPRDFGFLRSRWCCEVIALLMLRLYHLDVSRETIRRWLHRGEMVYRGPRPVLKPDEEQRRAKLAELRQLLGRVADDETAVFKTRSTSTPTPRSARCGCQGSQAEIETPGGDGNDTSPARSTGAAAGIPYQGRLEAGSECGLVSRPPRRPAGPAAAVQEDHVI